jgi:hypothetical protein
MDWLTNTIQWAGDTAKSAGSAVSNGAGVAWDATKSGASAAWDATKSGTTAAWGATKDVASATWDGTKAAGNYVADKGAAVQSLYSLAGGGRDKPMRKNPGAVDYGSFGKWPTVEAVRDADKARANNAPITVTLPFVRGAQLAGTAATSQTGSGATVQAPGLSFVYLDVGRWGGTKDNPTRDFGIVCGRTAAICAFTNGSAGPYKPHLGAVTTLTKGPEDEIGPINKLLAKLAGSALGTPQVRNYMTAKSPLPAGVQTIAQKVYVILGDMHLPAVTGPDPVEQKELEQKRIGRARRVDALKDADIMSDSDASLWHNKYIAAEIFQEAGHDLQTLVGQLQQAKGNVGAELWLLQLGDMFDLWLGFDCFLVTDPKPDDKMRKFGDDGRVVFTTDGPQRPDPVALPSGMKLPESHSREPTTAVSFVENWVTRTLANTTQGPFVQKFLQYGKSADGTSTSMFLHGNHDNYLANHVPTALSNLTGARSPSEYVDDRAQLYACHGHQFDKYNRDGAITGNFTTQSAFWGGQGIRGLESWFDSRDDTVLGVVALFRQRMDAKKPFSVFAMGHTHAALLAEVVVTMAPEPPPAPDPGTYGYID